jgi:hypothetical protein
LVKHGKHDSQALSYILIIKAFVCFHSEVGFNNWTGTGTGHDGHAANSTEEPAPTLVIVKNATQAAEDALKLKSNSTATPSASASGAAKPNSGASGIYAGMLPLAAAAIGVLAIGL